MAIQEYSKYQITPFWKSNQSSYKDLEYIQEEFNDPDSLSQWLGAGYPNKFTGDMCDMRSTQPHWNHRIISKFEKYGWKDIGTSYYRMGPGTILPMHSDLYVKYIDLFNLQGKEETIRRAVIFLEDWQSGHYLEICGDVITGWEAGAVVEWAYDAPHMAANMGMTPRYTLQVTGHI
jgi:hypothetical protein